MPLQAKIIEVSTCVFIPYMLFVGLKYTRSLRPHLVIIVLNILGLPSYFIVRSYNIPLLVPCVSTPMLHPTLYELLSFLESSMLDTF